MSATTNYAWVKPTVDADEDAWGDILNTAFDDIDVDLKAVSDAVVAAVAAAAAASALAPKVLTSTTFSASGAPGISTLAGYNAYRVTFHGVIPSGNPTLTLQLSFDGSTWKSGASDYAYNIISATNAVNINRNSATTAFAVTQNTIDSTASKSNTIVVDLIGPKAAGFGTMIDTKSIYWSSSNIETDTSSGQIIPGYGAPVGVRLVASTGTLTGGLVAVGLPGF